MTKIIFLIAFSFLRFLEAQNDPPGCPDNHEFCCFWASLGECDKNIKFMRSVCQKSCGCCGCTPETAASCQTKVNTAGCKWLSGGCGGQPTGGCGQQQVQQTQPCGQQQGCAKKPPTQSKPCGQPQDCGQQPCGQQQGCNQQQPPQPQPCGQQQGCSQQQPPQPQPCGQQQGCGQQQPPQPQSCGMDKCGQRPQPQCCGGQSGGSGSGPAQSPTFPQLGCDGGGCGGGMDGGLAGSAGRGTSCKDWHSSCRNWSQQGECQKNSLFMNAMCKQSCGGGC